MRVMAKKAIGTSNSAIAEKPRRVWLRGNVRCSSYAQLKGHSGLDYK